VRRLIGISPAGVEWVCYRRDSETLAEYGNRAVAMGRRLYALHRRHEARLIRIRGLTPTQSETIDDELDRTGVALADAGRSHLAATPGQIDELIAGIEMRIDTPCAIEEIRFFVEGGCDRNLTEAQIHFGVAAKVRSYRALIRKLRRSLRG